MLVPEAPPSPLPRFGERVLPAGTRLWRLHRSAFRAGEFNPCLGAPSRFAPIYDRKGRCIPTLYAGTGQVAVAFETMFRDLPPLPGLRQVFLRDLAVFSLSELVTTRNLKLAPFFNGTLALVGQGRESMIECHGAAAYQRTARWAEAVARDLPDFDGVIWTSRQHDEQQAVLLFRPRFRPRDLVRRATWRLDRGMGRDWIIRLASDYRVDLIPD